MILKKLTYLIVFASLYSTVQAQNPPPKVAINEINRLGRMLYKYDQAAWHGTDAIKPLLQDSGESLTKKVHGYIVVKNKQEWHVLFGRLSSDSTAYLVAFEAKLDSAYQVISARSVKKIEARKGFPLIAGRALALAKHKFKAPKQVTYNSVILPKDSSNAYVYFLPAQPAINVFYLGADYRYKYNSKKEAITETKRLHKAILTFDLRKKPSATTISTAVLTPLPTETDVFYAMSRHKGGSLKANHFVLTDNWVFRLDSTGIVETMSRKKWKEKMKK